MERAADKAQHDLRAHVLDGVAVAHAIDVERQSVRADDGNARFDAVFLPKDRASNLVFPIAQVVGVREHSHPRDASRPHGAVPPDGSRARTGDHTGGDDPGSHGRDRPNPTSCQLPGGSEDGNAEDRQKGRDQSPDARRGEHRQEAESTGQGPANCSHGVPATCEPKVLADVFVALAQQADEQGELQSTDKGCGQDYD